MSRIARAALTATVLSLLALTPAHAAPGDLHTKRHRVRGRQPHRSGRRHVVAAGGMN